MTMPSGSSSRLPNLPAGFRFHPTDEELIVHYLMNQASSIPCPVPIIAEVNIYHCNPWDLPVKALFGENEWYFFSPRDRKYPNGARPNRAAGSGYWKATGTDKAILSTPTSENIGVKKALVFYSGKPPKGTKTDWIMHEYRLTGPNHKTTKRRSGSSSMRLDDWVLCRIHKKSNNFQFSDQEQEGSTVEEESPIDNNMNNASAASPKSEALDHHEHHQFHNPTTMSMSKSYSITDLLNTIDYSALSQLLDGPPPAAEAAEPQLIYPTTQTTHQQSLLSYNNNNNNNMNMNNSNDFSSTQVHDATRSSDFVAANNNCNGLKRKRVVMTMDDDGAELSLDDGSSNFSRKLKLLPGESIRSSHGHFGSSTSSYCNQQQLVDTSCFQQYSSLLLNYPFLEMQ